MQPESPTAAASRQLHCFLSDEAHAGWNGFAARQGTNVSALLEAMGLVLETDRAGKKKAMPPFLRKGVGEARAIASARSSRGRGSSGGSAGSGSGVSSRRS